MSSSLFDSVARIARHELQKRAIAAVGIVEDVFDADAAPPDHAVTVRLRDTGEVLPRVPVAVGALGFAATPQAGDLVTVLFLDGDVHAPVIVGRLYHSDLSPPPHRAGEVVLRLPPGADDPGVDLRIAAAEPIVELKLPGEVRIELREEQIALSVGKLVITIAAGGSAGIKLEAGSTTIQLQEDGDLALATKGKLVLEGSEVAIRGSASVKIEGAKVDIN